MQVSDLFIREMPSDCLPRERLLAIGEKHYRIKSCWRFCYELAQKKQT